MELADKTGSGSHSRALYI